MPYVYIKKKEKGQDKEVFMLLLGLGRRRPAGLYHFLWKVHNVRSDKEKKEEKYKYTRNSLPEGAESGCDHATHSRPMPDSQVDWDDLS